MGYDLSSTVGISACLINHWPKFNMLHIVWLVGYHTSCGSVSNCGSFCTENFEIF